MGNGEYEIDESTFKKMPLEDQNWITFTTFNKYRKDMEERVCTLEKRKTADKAFACGSGLIGGFLAVLSKNIFMKIGG